ncbi:MAG TPA: hypothetical protein VF472_11075 [Burkholderiaceae bacterium]
MKFFALHPWLCGLSLALLGSVAHAADSYGQYLQSIQALEQAQAENHLFVIRYDDPKAGKLAHAVLDPARSLPMAEFYGELQKQGIRRGDLPNLLQPTLSLYENAFAEDPKHYEHEYLDSLELSVALRLQARRALAAVRKDQAARDAAHAAQGKSSTALFDSLAGLAAGADKALAATIRQDVGRRKYSADGAKRALKYADALEGS